uniref:Uncharacterized conserved protein, heparinase superfamily n=1 Tax=Candidatus Kentrum sp. FM TaxID=2126340 RepID=A0A450T3T7_9GAMM|nr:MAG: Uncharacterized conserved protein, heparinase superfamily [Candidatus Kentron sp. FM]VFJ61187.1 MAG: Uncharacterized conserved protein, heparinase superfamily [Candidatus Kentron sp. FM]VFK13602.1 MAG: Uncharacterized conserved protein, heparinase superfamily [Candidatus Kentron sp. FM]
MISSAAPLRRLTLLIHTIRYLRPVQLFGRIWYRCYRPRPDPRLPPPVRRIERPFVPPAARAPSLVGPRRFRFLNREGVLVPKTTVAGGAEPSTLDWEPADRDRLWRYNLHYFDDLNAADAGRRREWHRELLRDWVRDNPPVTGTGWEPYPTSLRMVNWIQWTLTGNTLPAECLHSLAIQARWLSKRLERHLLGNHLLANAKALVFAGLFFEGKEAEGWLATGLGILEREIPEQVLADGGHFERSTMYHALVLEDLLDLYNLVRAYPGAPLPGRLAITGAITDAIARMGDWLQTLCHPDGEIAFFNDAALGIAPAPAELAAYAGRLGLAPPAMPVAAAPSPAAPISTRLVHRKDSGYIRASLGHAVAFLDVAPLGPDYLPGHGHADTLSFELSVFGERVIVNGGTSRYGTGRQRLRERETRAHSTVEIDGKSSSEVWSGFRVARRARPFGLRIQETPDCLEVTCSHDGYRRLPYKPIHRRGWRMTPGGLQVSDWVSGLARAALAAHARFIVPPGIGIEQRDDNSWTLVLAGGRRLELSVIWGTGRVEPARYAPEFGKVLPARCLTVAPAEGRMVTVFEWPAVEG